MIACTMGTVSVGDKWRDNMFSALPIRPTVYNPH